MNPGSLLQRIGLNTVLLGKEHVCVESPEHGKFSCYFNLDPGAACLGFNADSIT